MNISLLTVMYDGRRVGRIKQNEELRMEFEYDPSWVAHPEAFAVSHSLPLDGNYRRGGQDHSFFANLLPEAAARDSLCRSLGISADNDYELLKAVGGECAGALQIIEEGRALGTGSYEPISDDEFTKMLLRQSAAVPETMRHKLRLSLAGAQNKWPVYVRERRYFWPLGDAPSSHILKLAHRDFKGLTWNEAYTTYLYGRLGAPTVTVQPFDKYSLVERYDRVTGFDGIKRIHQEDFTQILGYPSQRKYQNEGGPSFVRCLEVLRDLSSSPAEDSLHLIRWQILNVLLGNADGHAKNLSVVYTGDGIRLAPFYDLVCTRIYSGIDGSLAMNIGGEADPGHIGKPQWESFAGDLDIAPRLIFRLLEESLTNLEDGLDRYSEEFQDKFGNHSILSRVEAQIRKQLRRSRTLLG